MLAVYLIYWVSPVYGQTNILVYIAICSLIGSLSVMGCKGLSIALKLTLSGNSQLGNPLAWFFAISVAGCITIQMNYLNKSLDIFNTSLVTPIYYVMFTTLTITASALLFHEWEQLTNGDVIGAICGFLTIVCGVFLLHAFKDVNFTLMDLIELTNRHSVTENNNNNNVLNGTSPESAHRTGLYSHSTSSLGSQSVARQGSQVSLHLEGSRRTSLGKTPYVTNGVADEDGEEMFETETAPLVHATVDS